MAVAGIAAVWALFVHSAGSVIAGTVLLVLLAVAGVLLVVALRCLGITRGQPWMQRLAGGSGRDVTDTPDAPQARDLPAHAPEGRAHVDPAAARTVVSEFVTVAVRAAVPPLRLVTNGRVSETRISGARAGRGREVELALPEEPTVSRVHAEFTFTDGRWRIANRGLNGVTLNGTPLAGEHAIRDGDSIGWGTQPGVLASRVEIGRDRARQPAGPLCRRARPRSRGSRRMLSSQASQD